MLQILRNKAQSTVIQVIVVIIALVFVFWGVGTNMMNSREVAITVDDDEITFQQFQEAYDQAIKNLSAQFGGTLPKGLDESLGIKQQVIEQLIQSSLLRQGADRMGLRVSADEVRKFIIAMPQFQENGSFNMERYQALLAANRMTPNTFEASMRHDMLSDKTVQNISKFVILAADIEILDLYNRRMKRWPPDLSKLTRTASKKRSRWKRPSCRSGLIRSRTDIGQNLSSNSGTWHTTSLSWAKRSR